MIVLRKIRLFLRREEERCAVTACLLFEQGTQIRRDGEHLVDGRLVRVQARCRADRLLAGWGFGRGEGLADGAAVDSVFAGELADGQAIDSRVVADVGVQLHS